jgi:DNA-binding HxlR family transcriptional regulator
MNAQQQELLDFAILRVLDQQRTRFGETPTAIGFHLVQFGFPNPDKELLADRLDYLTRKGLVEEVMKAVNKANRAWRITEAGINHVDNHA